MTHGRIASMQQCIQTVKYAYKKPAYIQLTVTRKSWFSFRIYSKELVHYTFIRNLGYKEHIITVPTSSLQADFTVFIYTNMQWFARWRMYEKARRVCISGLSIPRSQGWRLQCAEFKSRLYTLTPGKTRSSAFTMVSVVEVNSYIDTFLKIVL